MLLAPFYAGADVEVEDARDNVSKSRWELTVDATDAILATVNLAFFKVWGGTIVDHMVAMQSDLINGRDAQTKHNNDVSTPEVDIKSLSAATSFSHYTAIWPELWFCLDRSGWNRLRKQKLNAA